PSAGITIAVALASALTGRPVRHDVAMTGEITLRGRVLPVGGVKEKVLAAHRAGTEIIVLPRENAKDLEEIPTHIRRQLDLRLVEHMDEVLGLALRPLAVPGPVRRDELAAAMDIVASTDWDTMDDVVGVGSGGNPDPDASIDELPEPVQAPVPAPHISESPSIEQGLLPGGLAD